MMRRLLAMERVTFHGEFIHVDGIELDVVHGRREPRNVPIFIGATGPKMMEMNGEICDGVVMNYCVEPEYNIRSLELLDKGARRTGRTVDDIDRPQLVVCSVDHDHDKAFDANSRTIDPVHGSAAPYRQGLRCIYGYGSRYPGDHGLACDARTSSASQAFHYRRCD